MSATARQAGQPKSAAPASTPARSTRRLGETTAAKPRFQDKRVVIGASIGGGILLLILISQMFSSSPTSSHPTGRKPKPAVKASAPVDVESLGREGIKKCEEGLAKIQNCKSLMTGRELTLEEQRKLKKDLTEGRALITEGQAMLSEANEKSDGKMLYDTRQYNEAKKLAGYKIAELNGP